MEPENIKTKLLFLQLVSYVTFLLPGEHHFFTQTIHCLLCWLQHVGQILIYSESNIRHLIKHWR